MSYSPDLGGMSAAVSGYMPAPADFLDAEDMRPLGAVFDIGGHGSSTPYTMATMNMLHKQLEEIREKTTASLQQSNGWKKRLREFMSVKNNELLDFLSVSVPSHPTLGRGEILLRRFGNPQVTPSHPSVRDMILDVSGEDVLGEYDEAFDKVRGNGGVKDYLEMTRTLFDEYRAAGEAVLNHQDALKGKLDSLDRIQGKLSSLFEIDPTDKWPPLMEATEAYLQHFFSEHKIEEDYKALIAAYRRFIVLRDVVTMSRSLISQENEPICGICLNAPVGFALVPCGHTFCQTCVRRQNGNCYMCRSAVKNHIKLYFA